ncbi:MAG TPA: hypothetical protein VMD92_13070 [Acidobacteriaceae bacterium]|nr:hypothetical protein [Acidobacteriaceae bacterium]
MTQRSFSLLFLALWLGGGLGACRADEPTLAATATFEAYAGAVEARLAHQHQSPAGFLGGVLADPGNVDRLRAGQLIVEQLTPPVGAALPRAMLHHWRATAFAPGATAEDFDRLMLDFSAWPHVYAPEVLAARVIAQQGDRYQMMMRVRQRHVLIVTMDTSYDVVFGRLDAGHRFSASRSTQISEIDGHGRALSAADEHGYLWRQNTYWSCVERDGGLYLQIESISLTRSIPTGLAWAIGPFVESVPRESLEFTLRATSRALRRAQ